jgi:hypothetical protein
MTYEKSYNKGSVHLTVWRNKTKDNKDFISYSLEKRYKEGDDWKTTNSYSEKDLQDAYVLLYKVLSVTVKERGSSKE